MRPGKSITLDNGRKMHAAYHAALMKLYEDTDVAKYYPAGASGTALLRTRLYMVAVLASLQNLTLQF